MRKIITVKLSPIAKPLWFDPADMDVSVGDKVVINTDKGKEMGVVIEGVRDISDEELKEVTGDIPLKQIERIANYHDFEVEKKLIARAKEEMPIYKRCVKELELEMKPISISYILGGDRCTCYFVSEDRVDFRQLVRDLAKEFHAKIDMRQIGPRDEAMIVGGYAPCGEEFCCAKWQNSFDPVTIRMAKDQDLPLNGPKISGVCGRLMCCLKYEADTYADYKKRAPKKGATISTPMGEAKVVDLNTPLETVTIEIQDETYKRFTVPLSCMTCSKECEKAAQKENRNSRPDTLSREALESLERSDLDSALSSFDRANGDSSSEFNDEDVLFISEARKQLRSKQIRDAREKSTQDPLSSNNRKGCNVNPSRKGTYRKQASESRANESSDKRRSHKRADVTRDVRPGRSQRTSPASTPEQGGAVKRHVTRRRHISE